MKTLTCIMCPVGCTLNVTEGENNLTVTGNTCRRGEIYARMEMTSPQRIVTSLFPIVGGGVVPCKTSATIEKSKMFDVIAEIKRNQVELPVNIGDVLIKNVLGSDVNIVATANRK